MNQRHLKLVKSETFFGWMDPRPSAPVTFVPFKPPSAPKTKKTARKAPVVVPPDPNIQIAPDADFNPFDALRVLTRRSRGITVSEERLLIYLVVRSDKEWKCHPANPTITADLHFSSERYTRKLVAQLTAKGLIRVTHEAGKPRVFHVKVRPIVLLVGDEMQKQWRKEGKLKATESTNEETLGAALQSQGGGSTEPGGEALQSPQRIKEKEARDQESI